MSNIYHIYKDNKLIKTYKYKKCMYKYINKLRNLSFSSSQVHGRVSFVDSVFYVVDNFHQIEFV